MLHPTPKLLPITVNATWLEVNQHSLNDTKYDPANNIYKTLEDFYARTTAQASNMRHILVGLPETAVLVEQMHRS
jgi:hypothetical protein